MSSASSSVVSLPQEPNQPSPGPCDTRVWTAEEYFRSLSPGNDPENFDWSSIEEYRDVPYIPAGSSVGDTLRKVDMELELNTHQDFIDDVKSMVPYLTEKERSTFVAQILSTRPIRGNPERIFRLVSTELLKEEVIKARERRDNPTSTFTLIDDGSDTRTVGGALVNPYELCLTVDDEFGVPTMLRPTCSRSGCGQPLIYGQRYNFGELEHSTLDDADDEEPTDLNIVPPTTCDTCGEGPDDRPLFQNVLDHRWHHTVSREDGRIQLCMKRSESAGDAEGGDVGSTTSSHPVTPLHLRSALVSASA